MTSIPRQNVDRPDGSHRPLLRDDRHPPPGSDGLEVFRRCGLLWTWSKNSRPFPTRAAACSRPSTMSRPRTRHSDRTPSSPSCTTPSAPPSTFSVNRSGLKVAGKDQHQISVEYAHATLGSIVDAQDLATYDELRLVRHRVVEYPPIGGFHPPTKDEAARYLASADRFVASIDGWWRSTK